VSTRALVTGGAGFLGRHLVHELAQRYDVVDCVDLVHPDEPWPGTCHVGDVRDVLPELGRYDAVVHLAAHVAGRAGMADGPLAVASNLALDVAFFEHVARTRPAHAAYLSSSAVYPEGGSDALHREDDVADGATAFGRPDGVYGWVKLTGEQLADVLRQRHGVPVLCYRPFTVYGPHQRADYPVPAIALRALAREDPLDVWGSGQQTRDLVHVDDAVAAIAATHARGLTGSLNVCTGVGTSVADLARLTARLVGYAPELRCDASKPTGAGRRVGSPERLHRWYRPRTDLPDGLESVLTWLEKP
jgi:nucleoside-diphosphate-sugar epimerase